MTADGGAVRTESEWQALWQAQLWLLQNEYMPLGVHLGMVWYEADAHVFFVTHSGLGNYRKNVWRSPSPLPHPAPDCVIATLRSTPDGICDTLVVDHGSFEDRLRTAVSTLQVLDRREVLTGWRWWVHLWMYRPSMGLGVLSIVWGVQIVAGGVAGLALIHWHFTVAGWLDAISIGGCGQLVPWMWTADFHRSPYNIPPSRLRPDDRSTPPDDRATPPDRG